MKFVDVTYSDYGLIIVDDDSNIEVLPDFHSSFIDIFNNRINYWIGEANFKERHIWKTYKNKEFKTINYDFLKKLHLSVSHELIQGSNKPRYYTPDFDYSTLNNNYLTISNTSIFKNNTEYMSAILNEFNETELIFQWKLIDHLEELGYDLSRQEIKRNEDNQIINPKDDYLLCNGVCKIPKNNLNDERFKEGNYLVSERLEGLIFVIDKDTKEIVWKISGKELGYHSSHYAHMIPLGLEGAGNILFYNNGSREDKKSSIIEFNPITFEIIFEYESEEIKSCFKGSVQKTIQNTYLICPSEKGKLVELNKNKNIVKTTFLSYEQSDEEKWNPNNINKNIMNYYRAERIPYEWIDKVLQDFNGRL